MGDLRQLPKRARASLGPFPAVLPRRIRRNVLRYGAPRGWPVFALPFSTDLQQCVELFHAEIGLPQDCPQRSAVEFFVIGHDELGKRIVATQDDMRAVLAFLIKAGFCERFDSVTAREPGQFAHTATRSVSKCSSGTGSLSSCKARM